MKVMQEVSVFLPTRKGSERVLSKNTRQFAGYRGGLLELKLLQLAKLDSVLEIVLSTNDQQSMAVAEKLLPNMDKLRIVERPDSLARADTNLIDLVNYVPSIVRGQHILWTHVTSPFVEAVDYAMAIARYAEVITRGYDSLMSVKKVAGFVWDKETNGLINRATPEKWPRTQDLKPLYEIDSAFFIASRQTYMEEKDRIGKTPFLFEQEGLKSFDIDWEADFQLAEYLMNFKSN